MEDILKKLVDGLKDLTLSGAGEVKARISDLQEYLKIVGQLFEKVSELATKLRQEINPLLSEKASLEKGISDVKSEHARHVIDHDERIADKTIVSEGLDRDIKDKTDRSVALNSHNQGLLSEKGNLDKEINNARTILVSLQRSVVDHKNEDEKLTKSIAEKKEEEAKLTESISHQKTEFSRLSDEIAIKEARNK